MKQILIKNGVDLKRAIIVLEAALVNGPVDLRYRPYAKSKSTEQLGYYYGCVLPLIQKHFKSDGNEYSLDQLDTALKNKFFVGEFFNPLTGKLEQLVKMKRNSTLKEMSEYLDKVIRFCSDIGIYIPEAKDYITIKEMGEI